MGSTVAILGVLLSAAAPPTTHVKMLNGAPCLFINGSPHPGTSYMTYRPDGKNFRDIGQAGVHLYSFSATPTESTYDLAPPCWVAPEDFDYSGMDGRARLLLDNDPEAVFFPRVYLGTPPWWADAHPDDLVTFDPGDGKPQLFVLRDKRVASWASETWREDTAEAMRRFIAHVEGSDYAGRVIGYHVASGTTEEWMQWGSNEDQWTDYSPVNVARFRTWLERKYGDEAALRAAWHNPDVTFATAEIPPRSERARGEIAYLRDPANAQPSIDYVLYTSWLVADTIRHFAAITKDAVNHKRLVGVFYGYLLALSGAQREQNAGHLALHDVLTCPDIDFITSPCNYGFRELGTGFPHAMSLADSVKHHGKLWFDENDFRTWLTPNVPVGRFGKTDTFEESLLCQQREFGWTLTNRHGMWWFDMGGGWYDDPRMLEAIGQMNRIAHDCLDVDGQSVAEIAFVVDPDCGAYLRPNNPFSWPSLILQQPKLGRVGAPVAVVSLDDLDSLPKYKVYIFPNCLAPTGAERQLIAQLLETTGAAAVWVGPAGVYRNGAVDQEAMEELTGLPLTLVETPVPWRIQPTPAASEWGWANPERIGEGREGGVLAIPEVPDAVVLGMIEGTDHPGLVATEANGSLTVFSSVPQLPASLLRAVARKAGVHLYIDTEDIVWASRDLLAVSVNAAGQRTVRLPRPCRVVDLWTGQDVAENAAEFTVEVPEKGTSLFRLNE